MKNLHWQEDFPPDITDNVILNAAVCQGPAPHFGSILKTFLLELLEKSVKAVALAKGAHWHRRGPVSAFPLTRFGKFEMIT